MQMTQAALAAVKGSRVAACLSLTILGAWLSIGCGPIHPDHISSLSGTWKGINSPGGGYFGTVVFDYTGHMDSLEITTLKGNQLHITFDHQPHFDINDSQYVATADTTLTDSEFQVKARVEYFSGKYKGVTHITVEGVVDFGSMTGTIRIAFPDSDPFTQDFTATKT